MSIGAFLGAILVFLFGVVFTSGVYGSRIAWLLGVSIPLLVFSLVLATGAFNLYGRNDPIGKTSRNDGVKVSKTIAGISAALIATPFAIAAMLFCAYGFFFVIYLVSH
jgi:hypothetical protein